MSPPPRASASAAETALFSRLSGIVDGFAGLRVAVWGDLIADQFIYGEIARVSREAPVLILKHREEHLLPGGGANAAVNLAALGCQVELAGVVGGDETGRELLARLQSAGVRTAGVPRLRGRLTPRKTRLLAGHAHTARQQVIRLDREPPGPLSAAVQTRLMRRAETLARRGYALLLSDYGYGAVGPAAALAVQHQLARGAGRHARSSPPILTVDSRFRVAEYAGLTAATPNEPEIEAIFHQPIGDDLARLEACGQRLLRRLRCQWLLVTRGRDGMALFAPRRAPRRWPVFGPAAALDTTGAGDTVIAVFTAALAAGADGPDAAQLANIAGGLVVMKPGTATVSAAELRRALARGPLRS